MERTERASEGAWSACSRDADKNRSSENTTFRSFRGKANRDRRRNIQELIHVVNVDTQCELTNILCLLRKVIGGVGGAENGIRPLPKMPPPLALLWRSEI
ncbi:hypothetical protein VNO77_14651 [Canavalia gladiata]|uniref:Uncharacterized protein n=1 Tax=Canavalia gladiata TaxID=3824 RepID=A0AAN9QS25_CANGL